MPTDDHVHAAERVLQQFEARSETSRGNCHDTRPGPSVTPPSDAATVQPVAVPATPLEDRTDTGNANLFVRLMGGKVRHVAAWNAWVVYDGQRWTQDATHLAESLVAEALLTRFEEAAQATDIKASRQLATWAASSRAAAKQAAALQVARSDRRVAARPEDFDQDPYLLNVLNGTLDLRSGELRRHDPADLIDQACPRRLRPGCALRPVGARAGRSDGRR